MQTKREKGLAFQRWITKWMEGRGWTVRNFSSVPKMIRRKNPKTGRLETMFISLKQDCFGADLVCRQFDYVFNTGRLYWIQATLDSNIKRKVDEFKKHFKNTLDGESLQIWIKNKKGEINIKEVIVFNKDVSVRDVGKIIRGKIFYTERPNHKI